MAQPSGMSDAEVFGAQPKPQKGMSDADVFGRSGMSDADVFGGETQTEQIERTAPGGQYLKAVRKLNPVDPLLHPIETYHDVGNSIKKAKEVWQSIFQPEGPDKDVDYKRGLTFAEFPTSVAITGAENEGEKRLILEHAFGKENVGTDSVGNLWFKKDGKKIAAHLRPTSGIASALLEGTPEGGGAMAGAEAGARLGAGFGEADIVTVPLFTAIGAGLGGGAGHAATEGAKAVSGNLAQRPGELAMNIGRAAGYDTVFETGAQGINSLIKTAKYAEREAAAARAMEDLTVERGARAKEKGPEVDALRAATDTVFNAAPLEKHVNAALAADRPDIASMLVRRAAKEGKASEDVLQPLREKIDKVSITPLNKPQKGGLIPGHEPWDIPPILTPEARPARSIAGRMYDALHHAFWGEEPGTRNLAFDLSDTLYRVKAVNETDMIRAGKMIRAANAAAEAAGATNEDWRQIAKFIERPGVVKLNKMQRWLFENFAKPVLDDTQGTYRTIQEMRGNVPFGDEEESGLAHYGRYKKEINGVKVSEGDIGYFPRFAKGKGSYLDRILNGGKTSGPSPGGLTKGLQNLGPRSYYAIQDANGNRQVVYVGRNVLGRGIIKDPKGRVIMEWSNTRPRPGAVLDKKAGLKLTDATMEEIESATGQGYYDHALAALITKWAQVRGIERNMRLVDDLKRELKARGLGSNDPSVTVDHPKWTISRGLPGFSDWRMEPRISETLEDAYPKHGDTTGDALLASLKATNDVLVKSIVFNPIRHTMNMTAQWVISRGLTGWLAPSSQVRAINTMLKAAKEVINLGPEYLKMREEGAAFQSFRESVGHESADIASLMIGEIGKDPEKWNPIARLFGFRDAYEFAKGSWRGANKLMWQVGDMMEMSRIMELKQQGYTTKEAIAKAEKVMVNYRIPSRVLTSRFLQKMVTSPFFVFSPYHFGLFKAYGHMVSDLVKPQSRGLQAMADRVEALDQMAALAMFHIRVMPFMDQIAQEWTGDKRARFPRPGMEAMAQTAEDVSTKKAPINRLIQGSLTPSPWADLGLGLFNNINPETGQQVYDPTGLKGFSQDMMFMLLDTVGPTSQALRAGSQKLTAKELALGAGLGFQYPNEGRKKAAYARSEEKSAYRHAEQKQEINDIPGMAALKRWLNIQ